MIFDFVNSVFDVLGVGNFNNAINNIMYSLGFTIYPQSLVLIIFLSTFICFLFRIIYKFKCALFGRKKRKKER